MDRGAWWARLWGHKESDMTEQLMCLEHPMDRGAGWASLWGHEESDMTEQLTHNQEMMLIFSFENC